MSKEQIKTNVYDALVKPVITEKSMMASENGMITFEVPLTATKTEIKAAVEAIYKVKVVSVNTIRQLGKTKRFRGRLGKRNDYKKAVIRLAEGNNIDVTAGI